jgi:hypothetical protein
MANLGCFAAVLRVVQPALGKAVGKLTRKEAATCLIACLRAVRYVRAARLCGGANQRHFFQHASDSLVAGTGIPLLKM